MTGLLPTSVVSSKILKNVCFGRATKFFCSVSVGVFRKMISIILSMYVMYVCMYVCIYVCMYVCMYVGVCMYLCK